jgi:tRNA threonylcarbamoyladenosine modification (KEOPS) complex  Pcc1 subunit
MEAEIIIEYDDFKTADSVAKAVSPDNLKVPQGLYVKTEQCEEKVITKIKCRKLNTFIATIDDLLSSISIAEKTLKAAFKLE